MKNILFWVLLLVSSTCFGAVNEKYSYKDFTGQTFEKVDPKEFSNSTIIGSCFYDHTKMRFILPDGVSNVTFKKCNLDNVNLDNCTTCITDTVDPKEKNTFKFLFTKDDKLYVCDKVDKYKTDASKIKTIKDMSVFVEEIVKDVKVEK